MKFIELLEELKELEENKKRIVLAKCGAFFVAIGRDALIIEQYIGLKLTCAKPKVCKIGIPVNSIMKYIDILEMLDYSFAIYDYKKETKKLVLKYEYLGHKEIEENYFVECSSCEYYKEHGFVDNINIFDILEKYIEYMLEVIMSPK